MIYRVSTAVYGHQYRCDKGAWWLRTTQDRTHVEEVDRGRLYEVNNDSGGRPGVPWGGDDYARPPSFF